LSEPEPEQIEYLFIDEKLILEKLTSFKQRPSIMNKSLVGTMTNPLVRRCPIESCRGYAVAKDFM